MIRLFKWFRIQFREPFTVDCYVSRAKSTMLCDRFRATGMIHARMIERQWKTRHPYGRVQMMPGVQSFDPRTN